MLMRKITAESLFKASILKCEVFVMVINPTFLCERGETFIKKGFEARFEIEVEANSEMVYFFTLI